VCGSPPICNRLLKVAWRKAHSVEHNALFFR
jgi:hypothetical protein